MAKISAARKANLANGIFQGIILETSCFIKSVNWGGGGWVYMFMFCLTSFFSNQILIDHIEKKFVGQNMNMCIYIPPMDLSPFT